MGQVETIAGAVLTNHRPQVRLDRHHDNGEPIEIFARDVAGPGGRDRPFLVYLQGDPG